MESLLKDHAHPGEVLKELYLDPLELSAIAFARHINVPRTRIERLVRGETGITIDTATRLARVFGTSVGFWINMQTGYDLDRNVKNIDVSGIEPLWPDQPIAPA